MGYQDYDEDDEQPKPKNGLREQLEAALAEKKNLEKELASLRGQVRERTVKEILTTKGVDPRIAEFIPPTVEGEEAVNAWLAEKGELFGVNPAANEGGAKAPAPAQQADPRLRELNAVAQNPTRVQDFEARIAAAQSDEEVNAIWAEVQKYVL